MHVQIEADNNKVVILDTNRDVGAINADLIELKHRFENRRIKDNKVKIYTDSINGGMVYNIETFYIKTPHDCNAFNLIWRVNARSFQTEGMLHIKVSPYYVNEERTTDKGLFGTVIEDYEEDIIQE